MPRSGTTLVEQILAAHPHVHAAGEHRALVDLLTKVRGLDGSLFPHWGRTFNEADCKSVAEAYLSALPTGPGTQIRTTTSA